MKPGLAIAMSLSLVSSALTLGISPTIAQSTLQPSDCAAKAITSENAVAQITALGRAKNVARQAAEAANGGLGVYRAEAAMHGTISEAPCVDNGDGTWTFTVRGGSPGFVTPTRETVVTIDSNSWNIRVDYNGPVRS